MYLENQAVQKSFVFSLVLNQAALKAISTDGTRDFLVLECADTLDMLATTKKVNLKGERPYNRIRLVQVELANGQKSEDPKS